MAQTWTAPAATMSEASEESAEVGKAIFFCVVYIRTFSFCQITRREHEVAVEGTRTSVILGGRGRRYPWGSCQDEDRTQPTSTLHLATSITVICRCDIEQGRKCRISGSRPSRWSDPAMELQAPRVVAGSSFCTPHSIGTVWTL